MSFLAFSGFYFFFSSRRRHTRSTRDWSSDVCSSDLADGDAAFEHGVQPSHPPAIPRVQDVVHPALDVRNGGKRASALARMLLRGQGAAVACAIANQRHVRVQEPGADELSGPPTGHRVGPFPDLEPAHFGP